jgi:acyl-coenzyme A synthetase/AMP-(fatty) acid ligase
MSPVDMEDVLMEHPRVRSAGVVCVGVGGSSQIAAYVECAGGPGDGDLADELRAVCQERLGGSMFPDVVTFVEELPRTLTGKVQRFRLRELAGRAAAVEPRASAADPVVKAAKGGVG